VNVPVLDILFCLSLLVLAWSAMRARDIFAGIVLFIVFGLLLALAWARLNAPDLALTEAALGAGLVGALFLAAQHRVARATGREVALPPPGRGRLGWLLVVPAMAPIIYAVTSDLIVPAGGDADPGLVAEAYAALPAAGVGNAVTATLLNYRAYDTLLELGVLLLVALGVLALHPGRQTLPETVKPPDPVLAGYTRVAGPLMVLVAGYILWAGGEGAGGAFQAGSVLAGAGVLYLLTFGPRRLDAKGPWIRLALPAGFLAFAASGLLLPAGGTPPLTWPPALAKPIILAIETFATLSIGASLFLLFAACADRLPRGWTTEDVTERDAS
jgi:multisubunit Na+/H+ antiporter MnhB subunit